MDALVLRYDCFKTDGNSHIGPTVSSNKNVARSLWFLAIYKGPADIRRGSLVRCCEMRVRSSKMQVFPFDRYYLQYEVHH